MDGVRSEITRASAAGGRLEQTLHQRPWKEAALPTPGSRLPVSRSERMPFGCFHPHPQVALYCASPKKRVQLPRPENSS